MLNTIFEFCLYNILSFFPIYLVGSAFRIFLIDTAHERLKNGGKNSDWSGWIWYSFFFVLVVVGLFLFIQATITPLTRIEAFKNTMLYGSLSMLIWVHDFWKFGRSDDIKIFEYKPFSGQSKPVSQIRKFKDIWDTTEIWKVLNISKGFGSPLVCFDYSSQTDPWQENTMKARVTSEDRGLVVGMPGSGKTSYLISQLIDWMQSGKSFVATDVKPEIWATLKENGVFEKYGYTDWVINPTDIHSHHYNIFSEAQSSAELNEILAVIIPNTGEDTEVFAENARRLLKAVVLELGDGASLPVCQKFINKCDDVPELLKKLRSSDNEVVVSIAKDITRTAKNENLLSSIMTALSKAFAFLDDERIRACSSRSDLVLKEVLKKPKQAVFLQFDQQYKATTETLFGAMVAHTLRILQNGYRHRDEVFVALDELINCAKIPKFLESLNTMRSAKMPTFMYFQAFEGLERIYGQGAGRLFMGACEFKAVYKIGDIETARIFSETIGETETTITNRSSSSSNSSAVVNDRGWQGNDGVSNANSNGSSTSVVTQMMQVFEASEFSKLDQYHAVCIYKGQSAIFKMPVYYEDYPAENRPRHLIMGDAYDEVLLERQRV